jgi:hypothetical protein
MLSVMRTKRGTMPTDRPERYAKQLASHWARRGEQVEDGTATTLTFETGQVVVLRPADGRLDLEVSVPDEGELTVDRWAQVVAEHLQRFGQRDELHVTWD